MKNIKKPLWACLIVGITVVACVDKTKVIAPTTTPTKPATSCTSSMTEGKSLGIKALPVDSSADYKKTFCKYTEIIAPNDKPIRIFAQDQISDEQMVRARRILEFFLSPVAGSEQGTDKTAIANAMASNGATLVLMNGSDNGKNPATVEAQPLYETELVTEGSTAYINNDYENHRDAAFEEILHMMHDYGIGTQSQPGANMTYSRLIDAATTNGMANNLWPTAGVGADTTEWIKELKDEGSLSQEYLASVIDSYYGYWGAWTETNGGMHGIYIAKTRAEVKEKDPMGYAVAEQYFSPTVTYNARIDSGFQGEFSLSLDASQPYTHKSQYLVNAALTGDKNSNLSGNAHDNRLSGNTGVNTLDGRTGKNTAIFKGNYNEYTVDADGDQFIINDSKESRDGTTTLKNIDIVEFNDKIYIVENGKLAPKP